MRRFDTLVMAALAVAVLWPGQAQGQRARTQVEEGNQLYREGRFDEAHQKYLEALLEDPESPLIRFNDGSALYQNQDFQRAMERFLETVNSQDPALRNAAWYNLGNALYRQQQLEQSLEAFKEALRADPSDADAKHNLERVLEQIQEQEQQDQNQNQEGGDQQDQQETDEQQSQEQQEGDQQEQDEDQGQEDQPQQDQPQEGEGSAEDDPRQGEGQPEPQPGEMTPEEAERLLDAIREDPGEVNRKRAPVTGRRPRKDW